MQAKYYELLMFKSHEFSSFEELSTAAATIERLAWVPPRLTLELYSATLYNATSEPFTGAMACNKQRRAQHDCEDLQAPLYAPIALKRYRK